MIRAVLDTDVLASGFVQHNPTKPPVQLLAAWRAGLFTLVVSDHIIAELVRTLAESYFRQRITPEQVGRLIALLHRRAALVAVAVSVQGIATHPEDDLILATAISGKCGYLVTGDTKLQKLGSYEGVSVVSPRQFIAILTEGAT